MVLSSTDIIKALKEGEIVYSGAPEDGKEFDRWAKSYVQPASLDISIGYETFGMTKYIPKGQVAFTPMDDPGVDSRYHATQHYGPLSLNNTPHKAVRVQPGQMILINSEHRLKLSTSIAAQIVTRSTARRWGWDVAGSAGWIDPGYDNYLTFCVQNTSIKPSLLFGGGEYAQLVFHRCDSPAKEYKGKYKLDGEWKPEHMLPPPFPVDLTPKPEAE